MSFAEYEPYVGEFKNLVTEGKNYANTKERRVLTNILENCSKIKKNFLKTKKVESLRCDFYKDFFRVVDKNNTYLDEYVNEENMKIKMDNFIYFNFNKKHSILESFFNKKIYDVGLRDDRIRKELIDLKIENEKFYIKIQKFFHSTESHEYSILFNNFLKTLNDDVFRAFNLMDIFNGKLMNENNDCSKKVKEELRKILPEKQEELIELIEKYKARIKEFNEEKRKINKKNYVENMYI